MSRRAQPLKHIHDSGGDGQVVILLHGFLASDLYWSRLRPYIIKAGYRVVSIDLLGFGNAPVPKDIEYSYADHLKHIREAINIVKPQGQIIIIGHSMGALIAARYATAWPGGIAQLIMLNPPLFKSRQEAHLTLRKTRLYKLLLDSRYRHASWRAIRTIAGPTICKHTSRSREMSLHNIIEAAEVFDDLQNMPAQTLLITGRQDRDIYAANLLATPISQSVTVLHEDVTHNSPVLNPRLIWQRIDDSIKKCHITIINPE